MSLGAPWSDAYLEPQQKEQSSVIFISQLPKTNLNISMNEPNGTWCPLRRCLSRTPTKGEILCDVYKSISNNPPKIVKLEELPWSQSMYCWQQVKSQKPAPLPRPSTILKGKQIHMSGLDMTHWKFCNHTCGQFLVSMNSDTINVIHTSQKSTI